MFDYSIIQIPKHICWYNYIKYTEVTPDPVYKMHGGAQCRMAVIVHAVAIATVVAVSGS